jgi:excisionase family DNA binding protein
MQSLGTPRRLVMTRGEAADAAFVSVATVDRAIASGDLPAIRVGPGRRLVRIRRADFDRWLTHSEEQDAA